MACNQSVQTADRTIFHKNQLLEQAVALWVQLIILDYFFG